MIISYQVLRLPMTFSDLRNDDNLNDFRQKLNVQGNENWEVYQIEEVDGVLLVFMMSRD